MAGRGRPRRFDREAALRTAMRLFWEHGYEGTSLAMLTAAMGITPTSLYAAFGAKDDLFREAVELYNSPQSSPTDRAMGRPTAREAVEAMLRGNADAYVDPETPAGCMVVLSGVNLAEGNEHIRAYLAECRRRDHAKVRGRIVRGTEEGDLPPGADADTLASYALTVLHGLSIQARDGADRERVHAVVDAAMAGWDRLARQARPDAASPAS
ncbi:TetR/AcrR family transcriptional regulator [Nocardiopsis sp. RSe5-2]|uniref:TetR/AcrR family transcriptional regulator n=1 Tax=Nocardiopsis endophytica TaxID=3018445 RepID=A0ABT4U4P0_9ACTN|nr:TetR/AcrR family transcriptional regulator [Nocardiopsis endophytica]MDA2811415.1 TetR/AcrR family transcriptional regulator [Nocardiopsis endophytica]